MERPDPALEGEIDLSEVLQSLLRHKWWIIAVAVGAAILAFLASQFMIQEKYRAQAIILMGAPRLNANLDNRLEILPQAPDPRAIPNAAMSEDVLKSVYDSLSAPEGGAKGLTFSDFMAGLNVSVAGNTVTLRVTDSDPQRAARSADLWAAAVAERLNQLYGVSTSALADLDKQVDDAEAQYQEAESALVEFLPQGTAEELSLQYENNQASYTADLAQLDRIDALLSDFQALGGQLAGRQPGELLSSNQMLDLLGLQYRAITELSAGAAGTSMTDISGTGASSTPVAPGEKGGGGLAGAPTESPLTGPGVGYSLPPVSAKVATEAITAYLGALETQRERLSGKSLTMEGQLGSMRASLESAQAAEDELVRTRDRAQAAYEALLNQSASLRIEAASSVKPATILSRPVPPQSPYSPQVLRNSVVAGLLGFLLAILVVLGLDWWRKAAAK